MTVTKLSIRQRFYSNEQLTRLRNSGKYFISDGVTSHWVDVFMGDAVGESDVKSQSAAAAPETPARSPQEPNGEKQLLSV